MACVGSNARFPIRLRILFKVVCDKYEPHIGRGPGLCSFGHYMVKPPLSFYGAEGMLHNGLSFPVQFFVFRHFPCIILHIFLELAPLYDLPVLIGGRAELSYGASFAGCRLVLLEKVVSRFVAATVAFQEMPLRTGIGVLLTVIGEMFRIVCRVGCL